MMKTNRRSFFKLFLSALCMPMPTITQPVEVFKYNQISRRFCPDPKLILETLKANHAMLVTENKTFKPKSGLIRLDEVKWEYP